jgi:hypothetical protein
MLRRTQLIHALLVGLATTPMVPSAADDARLDAFLAEQAGSAWSGPAELWLDPAGYDVERSDARLRVEADGIEYEWAWRGAAQRGVFAVTPDGLTWRDSWHQGDVVSLRPEGDTLAIFAVEYAYPAGDGPDWHWRMRLSQRPDGELVLQMTNVPPWGEEARAVRMVLQRED